MTVEELHKTIIEQQEEINKLKENFEALKKWSDLNDYWLREMIDALTESVDNISEDHCCCEKYNAYRNERKAYKYMNSEL